MRNLRSLTAQRLSSSPAVLALVVGMLFLVASLTARLFVVRPEILAPVWPATGVLMFALLRTSDRRTAVLMTVAAYLAGLAGNLLTSVPVLPSLIFSGVNCIAGIVGADLLRTKMAADARLNSIRNLAFMGAYGAGIANVVGATCGAVVIVGFHLGSFAPSWVTWWLSNALGIIIIMPLASELLEVRPARWSVPLRILAEAVIVAGLLGIVIIFGFGSPVTGLTTAAPLLVFPVLAWVGLRFNVAAAATASFVVTLLTLSLNLRELPSLAADYHALHSHVVQLQMYMIVAVASSLVPAVALEERRRAEESLRESEGSLRTVFDSVYDGIMIHDLDGKLLRVNQRCLAMYGLSTHEVPALGVRDLSSASAPVENLGPIWAKVMAEQPQFFEWDAKRPHDGADFNVEVFLRKIRTEGRDVIMANIRDITARKRAELAMRESESRLRLFIEHAPAAIAMLDRNMCYLAASHRWMEEYGLSGNIAGRCHYDVFPEIPERWKAIHQRGLAGEVLRADEDLFTRENGSTQWLKWEIRPWQNAAGEIGGILIATEDVTARVEVQQALRTSEQHLRAVAENIPQMIWVADKSPMFQYLSPKWIEYTGSCLEQDQRGGWAKFLHPDDVSRTFELWQKALDAGGIYEAEYRLRRHDGEYRWHLARAVPIIDDDGRTLWFGTTTDIEEQKRTHLALIRSEKLAATGRLASSMAHEINNPLAAALNSLYLALLDDALDESTRRHIDLAQRELERVAHITRQTLGFYRETGKPAKVDLRKVADSVIELYRPRLKNKELKVERDYRTEANVFAIEGEVRQIVANLFSNSIDAVGNDGCIRLRIAGPVTFDYDRPAVRLTVSDNGSGIEPSHLSHIFEPFFSTKEATGTGLGLWVTQQLVKKHQGKIRARSAPGRGTVFEVFLPLERRTPERLEQDLETVAQKES